MQFCTKSCHVFGIFEELTTGIGIIRKTRKILTRQNRKADAIFVQLQNTRQWIHCSSCKPKCTILTFIGPSKHRSIKSSNQRTSEPAIHRTIEPAIHRTIEPPIHRTIEPTIHRTSDASNQRTIEPANHSTTDPSNHRTNDPSNQRSIELTNQRSVEPSNRSINRATDPLNHRTFKPESDVTSTINVQNTVRSDVTGDLVYSAPAERSHYRRLQNSLYFCVFKYARAVKQ